MASTFHNEFFAGDAEALLTNSNNYLARSEILNRNAAALADYFATRAADPDSPVRQVLFPTTSDTRDKYESFMRKPTPDFAPGYGCLLSVEFEDIATARAFYDNLQLHCGPHLGAHLTLALPFNAIANGRTPEEAEYHASVSHFERDVAMSAKSSGTGGSRISADGEFVSCQQRQTPVRLDLVSYSTKTYQMTDENSSMVRSRSKFASK